MQQACHYNTGSIEPQSTVAPQIVPCHIVDVPMPPGPIEYTLLAELRSMEGTREGSASGLQPSNRKVDVADPLGAMVLFQKNGVLPRPPKRTPNLLNPSSTSRIG